MRAIETTATLTEGQLTLDGPLTLIYPHPSRVRVIVHISEDKEPEDDSIETIREGLYKGWQEALTGQARSASQLWSGLDVDYHPI